MICEAEMENKAKAKVVFKSAVAPRKKGTKTWCPSWFSTIPQVPTTGNIPIQLETKIKKKKDKTKGKNFSDFWRSPVMLSAKSNAPSKIISNKFCKPLGTAKIFRFKIIKKRPKIKVVKKPLNKELVTTKSPIWKIGSAKRVISWMISPVPSACIKK